MLRFVKDFLATSDHADTFGMFSLLVFSGFFLAVIIRITRMKKAYIQELSELPFGTEDTNENQRS
jgi:hypothetical protein